MNPLICLDDVHKSFDGRPVLEGLTFQLRPGEVYALLGRNGAGKTTALRVLLGFLAADAGRATILGADSAELTPALRERIGYVSEGHVLYRWMRVGEVLTFEQGTRTRFDLARARHDVARLGLRPDQKVGKLSRGQRAQLALCVAVATTPDVLVLDDPAMGLDAVMRREFLEAMIEVIGEGERGVLFSSHILSDVERIADRVGLLAGGRLIVDATLEDLKRRVQKRRVRVNSSRPPDVPGILRARQVEGGFELLLLDLDPVRLAALSAAVEVVSEPQVPGLEDLFLDLAAEHAPRAEEVA
ncbi:MAG TPA: ABC transporter ATP-binding protein [Planctomycetota bacterium]|nr:ABC transporter ATP-binding protein [Planctomycetota bacterium]